MCGTYKFISERPSPIYPLLGVSIHVAIMKFGALKLGR